MHCPSPQLQNHPRSERGVRRCGVLPLTSADIPVYPTYSLLLRFLALIEFVPLLNDFLKMFAYMRADQLRNVRAGNDTQRRQLELTVAVWPTDLAMGKMMASAHFIVDVYAKLPAVSARFCH